MSVGVSGRAMTAGYAVLVAAYFLNYAFGGDSQAIDDAVKVAPVLLLCTATWLAGGRGWQLLPLALLFSAAGDLAGEHRLFLWQVGFFWKAHAVYAIYFLRRAHIDRAGIILTVMLAGAGISLGAVILPHIASVAERIACGAYMTVISTMAVSAILRRGAWRWFGVAAALLFMFSDSCIAWNRFVERIPHAGVWIMTTYFAAQYIFARIYVQERRTRLSAPSAEQPKP